MDEDTSNSIFWGIVKWTLGSIGTLGILGGIFWALFYSVNLANLSFIIPLRSWYQDMYWGVEAIFLKPQRTYPPFDSVYTLRVFKISNNISTYLFRGTYSRIDFENGLIYLIGYNHKTYVFEVDKSSVDLQNSISHKTLPGAQINNITEESLIQITWDDQRTLTQIQKDYDQNSLQPLNNGQLQSSKLIIFN